MSSHSARFRWLVSLSIVLLLVWLLLASLMRTINHAEQQLVEEYTQTWKSQLGVFHGLWLAQSRPKQLSLNLYQQALEHPQAADVDSFRLEMNDAGWPQVSSTAQCLQLWRYMIGFEFSLEAQAKAKYQQQRCYYHLAPQGEIIYHASQGLVTNR
ncbi:MULTISPECIES: hypothetical protein [unclassified Agarivorans]|uniref:hypothetical protein n=1 Tax=unclassified Agarivorans TaxID=2636026 RepID=UPI003D7CAD38